MYSVANPNHNESITRPQPGQLPPILLRTDPEKADGWVTYNNPVEAADGKRELLLKRLPVRIVKAEELAGYLKRNLRQRSDFQRNLHLALNLQKMAEEHQHIADIGRLVLRYRPNQRLPMLQAMKRPLDEVGAILSTGLHGLMLVMWQPKHSNRLLLGLVAPTENQAIFALAAMRLVGRFGWATCQRDKCRTIFSPTRRGQKYCSYQCETAEAMVRYRAQLKRKRTAKKPARRLAS